METSANRLVECIAMLARNLVSTCFAPSRKVKSYEDNGDWREVSYILRFKLFCKDLKPSV